MTTLIKPKRKWLTRKITKKQVSGTGPGQSGSKRRKHHARACGQPGTPNGVCIKGVTGQRNQACGCGGCSAKGR
jgi:hypothetical protein